MKLLYTLAILLLSLLLAVSKSYGQDKSPVLEGLVSNIATVKVVFVPRLYTLLFSQQ